MFKTKRQTFAGTLASPVLIQPPRVTSTENVTEMYKTDAAELNGLQCELSPADRQVLLDCQRQLQAESRAIPKGERSVVRFDSLEFGVASGVFIPLRECKALTDNLRVRKNDRVLDIGTGTGVIGLSILRAASCTVMGVDINPRAVECANQNALRLGFAGVFDAQQSDVFDSLPSDQVFDVITINPPFLDIAAADDIEKAFWDHELRVHRKFFEGLSARLGDKGRAYICQTSVGPLDKVVRIADSFGFRLELVGDAPMFARLPNARFLAFEIKRSASA